MKFPAAPSVADVVYDSDDDDSHLAAADAAGLDVPAVHTSLRCNLAHINIALARRTRRHFDKNTASASGTECLQQQLSTV